MNKEKILNGIGKIGEGANVIGLVVTAIVTTVGFFSKNNKNE